MGYLNKTGIIGIYKGKNVLVIDYKDFTREQSKNETIYAVKPKNFGEKFFTLVYKAQIIGFLDDDGNITPNQWNREAIFKFYEPPVKKKEAQVQVSVPAPAQEIVFSDYTKPVDDFFEGLHELWKEMEV